MECKESAERFTEIAQWQSRRFAVTHSIIKTNFPSEISGSLRIPVTLAGDSASNHSRSQKSLLRSAILTVRFLSIYSNPILKPSTEPPARWCRGRWRTAIRFKMIWSYWSYCKVFQWVALPAFGMTENPNVREFRCLHYRACRVSNGDQSNFTPKVRRWHQVLPQI